MKNFMLLVLCLCSSATFAKEVNTNFNYSYTVTIDKNMSSISSANLAMSGVEAYRQFDDSYLSANNILPYFTRFIGAYYIQLLNHEIGGHGARAREFGLNTSYNLSPFNASTRYSGNSTKFYDYPLQKKIALNVAGIQASHLLAENIKGRYFEFNNINPTYGISYFSSQLDQPTYILFSSSKNEKDDIAGYIKNINALYNANYFSKAKLKRYAVLDLLDPFMWYSAYSYAINQDINVPMFKISENIEYLPATRAVLATYGLERKLVNHFRFNKEQYVQLSLSYGKNMNHKSYAVGVNAYDMVNLNFVNLGAELMVWSQPEILTNNSIQAKTKRGGLLAVNTNFDLYKTANKLIKGLVSIGFKSKGFVEGRPLRPAFLLRAGLQFNL